MAAGRTPDLAAGRAPGFAAALAVAFGLGFRGGWGLRLGRAFALPGDGLPFLGIDLPFVTIIVENAGGKPPVQGGQGGVAWPGCTRRRRNS